METTKTVSSSVRHGDCLVETTVTTKVRSAVVDYHEVLEASEVEPDEYMGPPWEEHDGWEHEVERATHPGQEESDAYYTDDRCRGWVVVPDPRHFEEAFAYFRAAGASRQVAREKAAAQVKQIVKHIARMREHGWEWWSASCEFAGHTAGCGGIDDYDYADEEVRLEVVNEVVAELEEAGFTVINKPEPKCYLKGTNRTAEDQRETYRRNLHLFDVGTSDD